MNDKARLIIEGRVTPFLVIDGKEVPLFRTHNAVQSKAPEAVVRALSGDAALTRVYFLYANTSSPSAIGASSGNLTATSFRTAGAASGRGLLSCPAFATGVSSSGDVTGLLDTASYLSVTSTDDSDRIAGIAFANGLYVYALGLVLAAQSGDVLYAASDITPVAKAANSQIGVRWKTKITLD